MIYSRQGQQAAVLAAIAAGFNVAKIGRAMAQSGGDPAALETLVQLRTYGPAVIARAVAAGMTDDEVMRVGRDGGYNLAALERAVAELEQREARLAALERAVAGRPGPAPAPAIRGEVARPARVRRW
ncbi:hypothetical protein ABT369_05385 [Dactylosporangium sp. NPDC000244]|uniref:hypothetical protein n=1 Tax=Dactylosporangium sp. NPDC000244 TaxID=3154365 RepID=UPI003330283E